MDGHVVVRRAEVEDADRIAELNMLLAEETEGKRLDRRVVVEGVKALLEDSDKGFYIVAERTDRTSKIVGQLMITFEWSDWRNRYYWWVQSVYVDREYRNRRVFSSLFKHVVELAESRKDVYGLKLYVEEHNEPAKKAYAALGMRKAPYEVYEMNLKKEK